MVKRFWHEGEESFYAVDAVDYDAIATLHARAIEALRGCERAIASFFNPSFGRDDEKISKDALAAANAVIAEEDQT